MIRGKAAGYAMLAVMELAKAGKGGTSAGMRAGELASRFRLPAAYVAKVLGGLARAGVLRSDRGPHGGFRLARPAERISVLDVLAAVGGVAGSPSGGTSGVPEPAASVLAKLDAAASREWRERLRTISVADVVRGTW